MPADSQLSLFGLTPAQDTFVSELWGPLNFIPSESNKWKDTCRHCLLWKHKREHTASDECLSAPCNASDRTDGRNGYFSIQQMPDKKQ